MSKHQDQHANRDEQRARSVGEDRHQRHQSSQLPSLQVRNLSRHRLQPEAHLRSGTNRQIQRNVRKIRHHTVITERDPEGKVPIQQIVRTEPTETPACRLLVSSLPICVCKDSTPTAASKTAESAQCRAHTRHRRSLATRAAFLPPAFVGIRWQRMIRRATKRHDRHRVGQSELNVRVATASVAARSDKYPTANSG